ncbi:MAG: flavodoxin [Arcobacteraceae bacterium]
MATAIFYASSTGNTEYVSKLISKQLGDIETFDIASEDISTINDYDKVILGIATWGDGELQDDWDEIWNSFTALDFTGKTIALFGLGDQDSYGENFIDAVAIVYEHLLTTSAKIVGKWPITDEYFYEESRAIEDGDFMGLALDEDNQEDLTEARITQWCADIAKDIL